MFQHRPVFLFPGATRWWKSGAKVQLFFDMGKFFLEHKNTDFQRNKSNFEQTKLGAKSEMEEIKRKRKQI